MYISRLIVWFEDELRIILARGIPPAADVDIHFAIILVPTPFIESSHAQDGSRFHVGNVANHQYIGSVTETAIQHDFCARPIVGRFRNAQVERSSTISPRIVTAIRMAGASPITGNGANIPVIATKLDRLRGR